MEDREKIAQQFINEVLGEDFIRELRLFILPSGESDSIMICKSWPYVGSWVVQTMSIPFDDREVFRPVLKDWAEEVFKEWWSCSLSVETDPLTGEKRPVKHIDKKEK